MRRIIYPLLVLAALLIAAVASLPFLVSGDFAASQLSAAVERSTGRKVAFLKPPYLKLWPELVLEAEDVRVSNPPGMFDGTMVSAEKLRIQVSLSDLVSRTLNVQELTLVRPRLTLVVDKQGNANWSTGKQGSTDAGNGAQSAAASTQTQLAPVKIEDGEIVYTDERSGASFKADNVNAVVSMANPTAPLDFKGTLTWNGQQVGLQSFVKSPGRLSGRGSPVDLAIQSRNLNAAFSGLARLDNGLNLAGTIDTSSPDLRTLAKWAGFEVSGNNGLKHFSTKAGLDLTGTVIRLKEATVSLDGMNARGSAKVTLSGVRPLIEAHLGVDRLNTNIYTGKIASPDAGTGSTDAGWSDKPIDLSSLKNVDVKLKLRSGGIVYGKVNFGETLLDINIANGKLAADLKKIALYDGTGKGTLSLDGTAPKPALAGQLKLQGLNALSLLQDFANLARFDGRLTTALDLKATGASQAEMVSTLTGTTRINITDGALAGIDLAAMVQGVQSNILGGWDKSDNAGTKFDIMSASFIFGDGIGRNDDLLIAGPALRVNGEGEIDLLRKRLIYKVAPQVAANGTELAGLAVPVIVKGPWADPKVYPDVKGILDDPQAAFDTLSKLGAAAGNVNVEAAAKNLQGGARKELKKALGDESAKQIEELGGKLLKQLFKQPKQ
jgi:AsmA protein